MTAQNGRPSSSQFTAGQLMLLVAVAVVLLFSVFAGN